MIFASLHTQLSELQKFCLESFTVSKRYADAYRLCRNKRRQVCVTTGGALFEIKKLCLLVSSRKTATSVFITCCCILSLLFPTAPFSLKYYKFEGPVNLVAILFYYIYHNF